MLCYAGFSVLLTKIRSLIHEEILLLSVLKFPFRVLTLLKRVHPSNNVLKALDVVRAQCLDKSVETLKADRSNLVNHDTVSVPLACHLEPEWPWPDPARHRTDYRHVGLVHGVRADHDARAPFLLLAPSPRRIEINPIDAKPDNLLNSQLE
jgi:hypothetical protein